MRQHVHRHLPRLGSNCTASLIENNTFFQTTKSPITGCSSGYKPGYTCGTWCSATTSTTRRAERQLSACAAADLTLRRAQGVRVDHPGRRDVPARPALVRTATGTTTCSRPGHRLRHRNVTYHRDKRANAPTLARPPASRGCRVALAPRSPGRSCARPAGRGAAKCLEDPPGNARTSAGAEVRAHLRIRITGLTTHAAATEAP